MIGTWMNYKTVVQGIACARLTGNLSSESVQVRIQEEHKRRLSQQLASARRQLENLERQANRTGDSEGFADQINREKTLISRLQRQLDDTRNVRSKYENRVDEIYREMRRLGCRNIA